MKKHKTGIQITLWVNRILAILVTALIFCMPAILAWYSRYRILTDLEQQTLIYAYACCAVVILAALWNVDRLLRAILAGEMFTWKNVERIRRVQLCCGGVCLICIPATVAYLPLIFLVVIMAFLCLAVGVLAQVIRSAVEIREENDLTI